MQKIVGWIASNVQIFPSERKAKTQYFCGVLNPTYAWEIGTISGLTQLSQKSYFLLVVRAKALILRTKVLTTNLK
ncbi:MULTISPECIES: hypothetical protein [Nostocaceae]|uniref:Uncharacterized protein n=1 Tax=Trichormus variabilis NIES-23 TaxID=1973479 RepID=A0A1Z4KT26_ANAVA|nr:MULTISPECIES: hypothetical protein [Nostocaceae]RUR87160.1 hypothetical protein DSM107007_17730 [Nostoc sp. PCC 7120 = FACHB-418]BAY72084.1 hypothetical protein NIES23_49080 [Trichormus variabilis NIES-23]HBW28779.1 hypothetical protein [Nostoc sp. UBA8866]